MGQKVHPLSVRLGFIETWNSRWYARHDFAKQLHEDLKIRDYIKKEIAYAGISRLEIERSSNKIRIILSTARPGVIIGRKGQEIDRLRDNLARISDKEVAIDVKEVKNPQCDAQLVAENIAFQLLKRIAFRRAMKKAIQTAVSRGVLGIKVKIGGRLGGSEIARSEGYREGKVPLQTFRANVQYGFTEAKTTYGIIGIKVWVYKGEVLGPQEESREREIRDRIRSAAKDAEGQGGEGGTKHQTAAFSSDELSATRPRDPKRGSGPPGRRHPGGQGPRPPKPKKG